MNEEYENYRFLTCIWMNFISFLIFTILGLYLENVLPGAVGVRKPVWFPFTKQFWSSSSPQDEINKDDGNKIMNSSEEDLNGRVNQNNFEEIPEYLKRKEDENGFLKISGLYKKFGSSFWAVNNLNAEMYEDQIFALLGHNGAGKTTTINML